MENGEMISLEIRRLIMTSVKKFEKYDELKKLIAIPFSLTLMYVENIESMGYFI